MQHKEIANRLPELHSAEYKIKIVIINRINVTKNKIGIGLSKLKLLTKQNKIKNKCM